MGHEILFYFLQGLLSHTLEMLPILLELHSHSFHAYSRIQPFVLLLNFFLTPLHISSEKCNDTYHFQSDQNRRWRWRTCSEVPHNLRLLAASPYPSGSDNTGFSSQVPAFSAPASQHYNVSAFHLSHTHQGVRLYTPDDKRCSFPCWFPHDRFQSPTLFPKVPCSFLHPSSLHQTWNYP